MLLRQPCKFGTQFTDAVGIAGTGTHDLGMCRAVLGELGLRLGDHGFQLGLSYTPSLAGGTGGSSNSYGNLTDDVAGRQEQIVEVGVNYVNKLGAVDLVILDEASQSDISELPALLRGKKILVVGDDRQVSGYRPRHRCLSR